MVTELIFETITQTAGPVTSLATENNTVTTTSISSGTTTISIATSFTPASGTIPGAAAPGKKRHTTLTSRVNREVLEQLNPRGTQIQCPIIPKKGRLVTTYPSSVICYKTVTIYKYNVYTVIAKKTTTIIAPIPTSTVLVSTTVTQTVTLPDGKPFISQS